MESKAPLTSNNIIIPPWLICCWATGPRSIPTLPGEKPYWVGPITFLIVVGGKEESRKEEKVLRIVFSMPNGRRLGGSGGRFFFWMKSVFVRIRDIGKCCFCVRVCMRYLCKGSCISVSKDKVWCGMPSGPAANVFFGLEICVLNFLSHSMYSVMCCCSCTVSTCGLSRCRYWESVSSVCGYGSNFVCRCVCNIVDIDTGSVIRVLCCCTDNFFLFPDW